MTRENPSKLPPVPAGTVPIISVVGYLGAGKTTLARNVLADLVARLPEGARVSVLENEFGAQGVDGGILRAAADASGGNVDMEALSGGCICCQLRADFEPALERLARGSAAVLVEASGVANPDDVAKAVANVAARVAGVLAVQVAVVDAAGFAAYGALPVVRKGVAGAHAVFVNKADAASAGDLENALAQARRINTRSPVVPTAFGDLRGLDLLNLPVLTTPSPMATLDDHARFLTGLKPLPAAFNYRPDGHAHSHVLRDPQEHGGARESFSLGRGEGIFARILSAGRAAAAAGVTRAKAGLAVGGVPVALDLKDPVFSMVGTREADGRAVAIDPDPAAAKRAKEAALAGWENPAPLAPSPLLDARSHPFYGLAMGYYDGFDADGNLAPSRATVEDWFVHEGQVDASALAGDPAERDKARALLAEIFSRAPSFNYVVHGQPYFYEGSRMQMWALAFAYGLTGDARLLATHLYQAHRLKLAALLLEGKIPSGMLDPSYGAKRRRFDLLNAAKGLAMIRLQCPHAPEIDAEFRRLGLGKWFLENLPAQEGFAPETAFVPWARDFANVAIGFGLGADECRDALAWCRDAMRRRAENDPGRRARWEAEEAAYAGLADRA